MSSEQCTCSKCVQRRAHPVYMTMSITRYSSGVIQYMNCSLGSILSRQPSSEEEIDKIVPTWSKACHADGSVTWSTEVDTYSLQG